MTDLTKDEIERFAKESRLIDSYAPVAYFATLCRAPLVAEVERLKAENSTLLLDVGGLRATVGSASNEAFRLREERDDWKARALKAEQVGEADELLRNLGLDPKACRTEGGHINHLKVKAAIKHPEDYIPQCQHTFAMSASYGGKLCKHCGKPEPQPAAQEPTSAVHVVEQLVEALDLAAPYFTHNNQVTTALAAGHQYLKENGK